MKRHIQLTGDLPEGHRGDFKTCPHCSQRQGWSIWMALAHTLILRPEGYRRGCAAIVSECPECFESSWVHIKLYSIEDDFPGDWANAAAEESKAQTLQTLRDWGASLCWKCSLLTSGSTGYLAIRTCEKGSGPVQKKCELFENIIGD